MQEEWGELGPQSLCSPLFSEATHTIGSLFSIAEQPQLSISSPVPTRGHSHTPESKHGDDSTSV